MDLKSIYNTLLSFNLILIGTSFAMGQDTLLIEDFSTASGTTPPTGWTIQTAVGDPAVDVWHFDNPGRRTPGSPISSPFAVFDSDTYSNNGTAEAIYLVSPAFDATTDDDILLELFASGNPQFSHINFENNGNLEEHSKILNSGVSDSNIFRFYITDEFGSIINLNNINLLITLIFYEKENTSELIRGYIRYKMLIDKEKSEQEKKN